MQRCVLLFIGFLSVFRCVSTVVVCTPQLSCPHSANREMARNRMNRRRPSHLSASFSLHSVRQAFRCAILFVFVGLLLPLMTGAVIELAFISPFRIPIHITFEAATAAVAATGGVTTN